MSTQQPLDRSPKQRVWFSPYLLALVLSPVVLQTSTPLSCAPTGAFTLSVLELEVLGTNEIAFTSAQRSYDVWLPVSASSATVRATSTSPIMQVSYGLSDDGGLIEGGSLGTGGGEVTIQLEPGLNTLRVSVKSPGGASSYYTVGIQVGCSDCDDGNECTADTCDPVEETCVHAPVVVLTKAVFIPLQANVGDDINVSATASGTGTIDYLWTATAGSFADPTAPITTYRCEEAGQQDLMITVSDGTGFCTDAFSVTVTCL